LEKRNLEEQTRSKLSLIAGQLTRIQGILRELMNFSRPANPQRTRFEVREIIEEALNIAKYYQAIKSRVVETEIANDLPPIFGVRDQVVQVIFNLLLNAIDATPRGGLVRVEAHRQNEADNLEIIVSDNGHGLSDEQKARLFTPYFTTKKQGTGLGLFVSQKLIRAHGGEMTFESTLHHGTTFRLTLPCQADEQPPKKQLVLAHAVASNPLEET
jgi:two-component system, NtrC family, sensor kinase